VELAGDGAALAPEEGLADERLPRLELVARELADPLRHLAGAVEAQVRRHPVERVERERDLEEVRVARALAHPVDRPLDPARARLDRGHGGRSGEPEVVVPVEVDGHVRAHQLDGAADKLGDGLRCGDPERVDDRDLLRPRLHGDRVRLLEEDGVGPRRVDPEIGDRDTLPGGEGDGLADALEHRLAADPERVELQVRDRRLDDRGGDAQLEQRLHVGRDGAREPPHLGL
jgi:hypothetical protein